MCWIFFRSGTLLWSDKFLSADKGINFENIELIHINDGSTDNSDIIVKKVTDKRIVYLENKENNDYTGNIKTLINRYNPDTLSETGKDAEYTSYSVNKGQKISICIRNKDNSFIDNNTVIFVVIHELAHVMTDSIGHTKEFWDNMKYLLERAEEINIYSPQDYNTNPINYCGMEINSTPYDFKK